MQFGAEYEDGDKIIGEYKYILPINTFESVGVHTLSKGVGYVILRETKDHLVIDIGVGEEKVKKTDINKKYELVNKSYSDTVFYVQQERMRVSEKD